MSVPRALGSLSLLQHRERLAHARRRSEVDHEPTPLLDLGFLTRPDRVEEGLWDLSAGERLDGLRAPDIVDTESA